MSTERKQITVKKYFESFPEPYRTRALNNLSPNFDNYLIEEDMLPMHFMFDSWFVQDIPERKGFWTDFYTYLKVKRQIESS